MNIVEMKRNFEEQQREFYAKENQANTERYKGCKVLSVSTAVGGQYAHAYFLVVVKMTNGTVELKQLSNNAVFIIDEGSPYIGGYGNGDLGLYITEADLVAYLN